VIETPRLILRDWRAADLAPFAAMSADPAVMETLGGALLTQAQSRAFIESAEAQIARRGFGRWAVERREDGAFIGVVGLAPVGKDVPLGGFEIAWRLARNAWGFGYATEAARAALAEAFERGGLQQVWAFTSVPNLRSQAVMGRLGLTRRADLDFDHPALPRRHPQRPHMVWAALPQPAPPASSA